MEWISKEIDCKHTLLLKRTPLTKLIALVDLLVACGTGRGIGRIWILRLRTEQFILQHMSSSCAKTKWGM